MIEDGKTKLNVSFFDQIIDHKAKENDPMFGRTFSQVVLIRFVAF